MNNMYAWEMQPLLWHCPKCDRLFSNLVTLYAPLSANYFSYLPQCMKMQNYLFFFFFKKKLYNKHCHVPSAAIERALPSLKARNPRKTTV